MKDSIIGRINFLLFNTALVGALLWGWSQRDEFWVTAEEGLGYYFGIAGGSMMLLLLLYPLRKTLKFMRNWLPVKYWFRAHMLFGVLGPTLILFHSNFSLGSVNSNVALFSMLLVVASGLVGRYLYRHTHNGLYGKQLDYHELRKEYLEHKQALQQNPVIDQELLQQLQAIEEHTSADAHSLMHSWRRVVTVKRLTKRLYRQLSRYEGAALRTIDGEVIPVDDLNQHLREELRLLRTMVGLALYNRLFSIWHIVHLPFFIMMIITAVVHVVVVHMY